MDVVVFFILALTVLENVSAATVRSLSREAQPFNFPKARRLSAAVSRSKLESRAELASNLLRREASFDFLHGDQDPHSVFVATLDVKSKSPILALEELDDSVQDVICKESQVDILFGSIEQVRSVHRGLEQIDGFILVTSHSGCNPDGARSTYRVNKVVIDPTRNVLSLGKSDCGWQDAFHTTRVSFSRRHPSEVRRRSNTPTKRQQQSQSEPPEQTKTMGGSTETPTATFPAPSATSGLASTTAKELNEHYVDRKIFPPDIPAADMLLPSGLTVSCKNCSLEGNIVLDKGSFEISGSDGLIDAVNSTIAFFDHGSIEVIANGLFAQIELEFDLSASQDLGSFTAQLPAIPLIPFEIPGVLVFGPIVVAEFDMSLSLDQNTGFSYGFNLSVPANSKVELNMDEISNSSITGFDKTTVHALPFQAKAALVSLIASIGFKPRVLLGINTAVGSVQGGVGAFLELPKVSVNVTQLRNVNEKCESVSNGEGKLTSMLDNIVGDFTNIVPTVDINLGALANFEVDVPRVFTETAAVQTVLASTSYPLPTACLQFDSESGEYSSPTPTPTPTSVSSAVGKAATAEAKKSRAGSVGINRSVILSAIKAMSANQSLFHLENPARADEWATFDNSFEFASGYLESNPPSLDSISPKDLELVYSDADALNWDSEAAQWPQSAFSDLVAFEDPLIGSTEMPMDMAGFSENVPPLPSFPEMECSSSTFDATWSSFNVSNMEEAFYSPSNYRQLIESQAAADPRCFSKKEKRLEASIALHLQRLQDAATTDFNLSSESCGSFSSPCWPGSAAGSASEPQSRGSPSSTSASEPSTKSSTPPSSRPSPANGGVELVLDLNMNTTTNLPKKQKPRSQAQKENYIKVRKHGACEKHRKQHKRCNCLDKSTSRVLNDSAVAALAQSTNARLEVRNTGQNVIVTKRLGPNTLPTPSPAILDRSRAVKAVPGSVQPSIAISPTIKANVQRVERTVHDSAGRVNTAISPTVPTNVRPSERSAHNSAGRASMAISWTPAPNTQVMGRIVQNSGGHVVSLRSPANVQRSERSAQNLVGQQNTAHGYTQVRQSPKEARPWRTDRHTSPVQGASVTQNVQVATAGFRGRQDGAVCAVQFTPGLLRESSGVLRPFRYKPTSQHDVGKLVEAPSTQANKHAKGKATFWPSSWAWSLPGSQAEVVQNSTVAEYAGVVIRKTALAFLAFWQSSTSLTSWAGVLLGQLVLSSSRQHMLARKGLGLA
ncbi:hypothetical protein CNMCM8812_004436 [Aspergillus fumigatus]|nr:hypothetical protein CNMCM8057_002940 [Aspergillus fumigatus]KAF4262760.1 hypothetical protein CNMCM8812_004436 [Aspergillus fumigatus]KAH1625726.1 hypothetical protein KXX21_006034 [Aspergillus fumigatus]KAH3306126.1 hypothetical protein KXV87_009176 [Aspergillus fumigatus]